MKPSPRLPSAATVVRYSPGIVAAIMVIRLVVKVAVGSAKLGGVLGEPARGFTNQRLCDHTFTLFVTCSSTHPGFRFRNLGVPEIGEVVLCKLHFRDCGIK